MGKDQEFLEAARNGNVVIVEKLLNSKAKRGGPLASLRRGPGANVQDSSGYSALHHAALNGHREIVVLLLQHEASPNITDSKGSTPLHLASWAGHSDIVRLLLTTGVRVVQINQRNKDNETALHCASQYGHTSVVSLLLNAGADPGYRNVRDETALDLAAQYGRLETVELLLQSHPELIESYRSLAGTPGPKTTPLHAASRNGHRSVVETLLIAGFPVSYMCPSGTALHEAALCGKVDVVRRLLEAGVDVSLKDGRGFSALRLVQDLPTPVAQDIATLIKNRALLDPGRDGQSDNGSPSFSAGMPSRFPTNGPISPYENCSIESSIKQRESTRSSSSITADSFITLPRRRHKVSTSSCHSQKSGEEGGNYEVPPPPRSLPWMRHQRRATDSSSHSDLLDDESSSYPAVGGGGVEVAEPSTIMSRSFDARSLDFLSDTNSGTSGAAGSSSDGQHSRSSAFSRTSRSRHSADQYLPMTASSTTTKISPNPPQKPPRKLQGMSAHYESLPRSIGRPKPRQMSCYSVDPTPSLPSKEGSKKQPNSFSSKVGGYELVYLARTGSSSQSTGTDEPEEQSTSSPRFRIGSTGSSYVDMAQRQPSSYENVFPVAGQTSSVDDDSIYDLPRELGGSKLYENVHLVHPGNSSSSPASPSTKTSTPDSPSRIAANLPPTPDHPPPPAHQAEHSIHLRMRPLSEELKRKSRDIETYTEEELFLAVSTNGPDASGVGSSSSGSYSASLSSDISGDNIEEVLQNSETPFEGLLRGSVPVNRSSSFMERPNSLPMSHPPTRSWTDAGLTAVSNGRHTNGKNSLSVLSPFDEQEEWLKILEILNACNTGLGGSNEDGSGASNLLGDVQRELQNRFGAMGGVTTDVKKEDVIEIPTGHESDSVADWLLSLGLQQYSGMLLSNGYDDINFLGDGIMDDSSLLEIGILDAGHRTQMVEASLRLPPTPLRKMDSVSTRPSTLEDWLHLLQLDHYVEQFRKNRFDDMDRITRIWEVELTTVIEIRLVGHLRRILASLKPIQQQPINSSTAVHPVNKEDFSSLSSDLNQISSNLAKLGDEINQKMSESTHNGVDPSEGVSKNNGTLGRRKSRHAPQPPATRQTSYQALESVLDSLTVRNPSDLVIGIAKTVGTQWRHQPHQLLRAGVCYEAQYLGSTLVRHVRGTESTKRSIQKLKKKHAEQEANSRKQYAGIVLAISLSGVQFLDPFTQETICKHDIRNINWACQDADDLTHFAYITKDQQQQDPSSTTSEDQHFCHVFQVSSMDLATEVILTLGQAFEVAYQLVLREDLCSAPFAASNTPPSHHPVPAVQPKSSQPPQHNKPQISEKPKTNKPAVAPKPAVLPKPKLGTALLQSKQNQHAKSQSNIDRKSSSGGLADARLQSESNLASLTTKQQAILTSSVSVSSGRAPLAAKDEL